MAAGDLTASTPVVCEGLDAVETQINTMNLAATTDHLFVVPYAGRDDVYLVFKVERAAA